MAAARKNPTPDEGIHKMETMPPPEGEDDAYNAATKIGPMARGFVEALMAKAQAEENSSMPPPISTRRGLTIPKAGRVPTMTMETAPNVTLASRQEPEVQRMYDDAAEGDLFDPTALFTTTPAAPSAPLTLRCDADWTRAPTMMAMSVQPLPTPMPMALAPLLEPAPVKRRRRSTAMVEVAIFVGTFLLVAIPAAIAYWVWMR